MLSLTLPICGVDPHHHNLDQNLVLARYLCGSLSHHGFPVLLSNACSSIGYRRDNTPARTYLCDNGSLGCLRCADWCSVRRGYVQVGGEGLEGGLYAPDLSILDYQEINPVLDQFVRIPL